MYLFLSVAIAVNLQWIVLMERQFKPWMEGWIYYFGSLLFSLLFAVIPFAAGRFGFDRAQGFCWYQNSHLLSSKLWEVFTFIVPVVICIIYCNIVVGMVVAKIIRENRSLKRHLDSSGLSDTSGHFSAMHRRTRLAINQVIVRILAYPLIPFITQSVFIASEIYWQVNDRIIFILTIAGNASTDLPGVFNCLAFLIDPAVSNSVRKIRWDFIERYADDPRGGFRTWFVRKVLMGRMDYMEFGSFSMTTTKSGAFSPNRTGFAKDEGVVEEEREKESEREMREGIPPVPGVINHRTKETWPQLDDELGMEGLEAGPMEEEGAVSKQGGRKEKVDEPSEAVEPAEQTSMAEARGERLEGVRRKESVVVVMPEEGEDDISTTVTTSNQAETEQTPQTVRPSRRRRRRRPRRQSIHDLLYRTPTDHNNEEMYRLTAEAREYIGKL
ncbi:uncharacterized protein VTP21DRAFT_10286 [Calcarisporiella thermophila]|uniref:uncharacterized protein n=1 Tax=Calcarisporiella thermophila TaxID=911321 RepID=UPI0037441132